MFCLGEMCPPAVALMPDMLVPPHMPLVPLKLLPQSWNSEGMSLSKSMREFFKRNCLGTLQFLPPTQSPLAFAARSYGDLSSCHWNPGLGGPVVGLGPLTPKIYPSQSFIHHIWMRDQSIPHLCPSYQSGWIWFI